MFPPVSSFSRRSPSLFAEVRVLTVQFPPFIGTMAALRLLSVRPVSLRFPSLDGTGRLPLFCTTSPPGVGLFPLYGLRKARSIYTPPFPIGGLFLPETISPLTFPYDLPRICPALRPRLRVPTRLSWFPVAPALTKTKASYNWFFVAHSRGFCARCLRTSGPPLHKLCRQSPCKTRFR
jgi:hypothetical protein